MSQRELRVVWVNPLAMSTNAEKRAQERAKEAERGQKDEQSVTGKEQHTKKTPFQYVAPWLDRKQIGSGLVILIVGALLTGLAFMVLDIFENRIADKVANNENLANRIVEQIGKSKTFQIGIADHLKNSEDVKELRKNVEKLPGQFSEMKEQLGTQMRELKEQVGTQIGEMKVQLGRLDERVKGLEREVFRSRAQALGITNPDIQTVALRAQEKFETTIPTAKGKTVLRYTILRIEAQRMVIRMDYRGADGSIARDNVIEIKIVPNEIVDLSRHISIEGMPRVLLAIVARPSPDSAVLAIGPAAHTKTKSG